MRDSLPSTSRSLPIALIRARERVMSPIREMLAKSDITEQQWRILRVLSEYGEMDSTSLASRSALLTPSLTRIINSMLSKGLVTQRRDAQDKRRQRIDITTKGQMIIDDNLAEATSIMQTVKQTLGTDNYEKLLDLLDTYWRLDDINHCIFYIKIILVCLASSSCLPYCWRQPIIKIWTDRQIRL